jgi:hypothetical protein
MAFAIKSAKGMAMTNRTNRKMLALLRSTATSLLIACLLLAIGCTGADRAVEPAAGEAAVPGSSDTEVDVNYEVGQGQRGRR